MFGNIRRQKIVVSDAKINRLVNGGDDLAIILWPHGPGEDREIVSVSLYGMGCDIVACMEPGSNTATVVLAHPLIALTVPEGYRFDVQFA